MELYVLDGLLRRTEVIDSYESLIWTDRYSNIGDFQLELPSDNQFRKLLQKKTLVALDRSDRVMMVETVKDGTDAEGNATLQISGVSLESVLKDRIARPWLAGTNFSPKWVLTGTPADICRSMFQSICRVGMLTVNDKIPFMQAGTLNPAGNIPEPSTVITAEIPLQSLYSAIHELCDIYDLGFRIVRNGDTSQLYFEIYTGNDHTTQQTTLPAVIISPSLENMRDVSELTTFAGVKNVAYVFSPVGYEIVYAPGYDASVSGLDRQVLTIEASDVTDTDPLVASARMIQKGREELLKARPTYAFDGEIDPYLEQVYGVDYGMGDLITSQTSAGTVNGMKITEQIFVSDKEGVRSYPTLSVRSIINAGSWLSWNYNQVWQDLDSTTYWADQ